MSRESGRDGDGDPGNDPEREGYYRGEGDYTGERGFNDRRRIGQGHALLAERDPRTFRNRSDKWGDRAFLVQASDVSTNPGRLYRSRATLVDTREFPIPRPIALQFRFQTVVTNFPNGPGPFVPLAQNWNPTPSCDCVVSIRRSLGPDGGVSEEIYDTRTNTGFVLFLPRIVLAHKVQIDVECFGGFDEVGANSLWVEVWAAPVDTVQPTSLINPAAGDLTGYLFGNTSRFPVSAVSQDFLFPEVRRRQFIVHNNSQTQSLALGFGVTPSFAAGAELWSVFIPPGAQYEAPIGGWIGAVKGIWSGADAAGEALVFEGRIS